MIRPVRFRVGVAAHFIAPALLMCLIVFSPNSSYAEDNCEPTTRSIAVDLKINLGQVNYFNNFDRSYLASQLSRTKSASKVGWVPSGMTSVGLEYSIHLSVQVQRMSSGLYCSELRAVDTIVGYKSVDVYIANDYAPGSCQYNSILDHEHLHVGVYQDTLVEYAPRIETELRKAVDRQDSVITDDSEMAVKILQARIEKPLKFLINRIDKILEKRNAALDTMENYHKEQEHCSSW